MAAWQRLGRAPRPLEVWHAFRISIDMLILRDRRGQIIYDWQQFTRLWLSDYPVVANTTIMVGGDAVHIRTQWTGGTEAEDITLTESGHLFESCVSGGRLDGLRIGFTVLIDAIRGHDRMVTMAQRSSIQPRG